MGESIFRVGGSLPPDAQCYVTRQADEELFQGLLAGTFCYVLNCRQMGKSSLQVRTMARLQKVGVACADLDLTEIGSQEIAPRQWYGGVTRFLAGEFGLDFGLRSWWRDRENLSPVQCFGEFLETVLLAQVPEQIVLFIDEIDGILSLPFKDDFFALIRALHNKRSRNSDLNRLTFALLGVASPSD